MYKTKLKTVAILMATYNGEKFIRQQILSILEQKNVSIQIFISDDCSSDNTLKIIEDLYKNYGRIHVVSTKEKFGSAAPNFFSLIKTVDISKFDYVAFSDQDDIWLPEKLEFAIRELKRNHCNGFSSSVTAYWPQSEAKKLIIKATPQTTEDHWFESPGPGCSQVFTCKSFIKFKDFICDNYEFIKLIDFHDWMIYAFFKHHQLGWHISPTSKMLYVQHETNQMGANSGFLSILKRFNMVRVKWLRNQTNLTYKLISGEKKELITLDYMLKNALKLRREKRHSISLLVLYICGLL